MLREYASRQRTQTPDVRDIKSVCQSNASFIASNKRTAESLRVSRAIATATCWPVSQHAYTQQLVRSLTRTDDVAIDAQRERRVMTYQERKEMYAKQHRARKQQQ